MDRTDRAPMTEDEIRAAVVGELTSLHRPDTNVDLHVFTLGASEIERMLLFRDAIVERPHGATAVGSHPRTDDV